MRAAVQVCLGRVATLRSQHAFHSRGICSRSRSRAVAKSANDSKASYSFQELGIDKDLYDKTSGIRYVTHGVVV